MFKRILFYFVSLISSQALFLGPLEGKEFSTRVEISQPVGLSQETVRGELKKIFQEDGRILPLYEQIATFIGSEMTEIEGERVYHAILFAAKKHAGKIRLHSEQEPYLCYPLTVANLMIFQGEVRDPDLLIAALLHDSGSSEDLIFLQEIESAFGSRVANLIKELAQYPVSAKKSKQHDLISHADKLSQEAALVDLAILLYNLQELQERPPVSWDQMAKDHYVEFAESLVQRLPKGSLAMQNAVENSVQTYWQEAAK